MAPPSAPGGATGTASGAFTDACDILDLAGTSDPEALFPAADFLPFWRQAFTTGVTGAEAWIVLADTNGALQWHQQA